jgi:hypothetical protein
VILSVARRGIARMGACILVRDVKERRMGRSPIPAMEARRGSRLPTLGRHCGTTL